MITIDVGTDFYFRLANRNELQGDGKYTAIEFRQKYLSEFDSESAWNNSTAGIILDFKNVKRIGPSFANEAFGYFMKYTTPENFLKRIVFQNIDNVDVSIIRKELESGYHR